MQTEAAAYQRIVLKLSGEALQVPAARENISPQIVLAIAERIKEVRDLDVQVGVVIGGGNIWRGTSAAHRGMDRTTADYMGMLATVINGLALQSACAQIGVETRVQTAIEMKNVAEPFIRGRAIRHLELGRVVIFVAGTGNPYFSTDTTAALRKRLQVMDSTAFSLCMDNKIPIVIFNMNEPDNIRDAVLGRKIGTLVCD